MNGDKPRHAYSRSQPPPLPHKEIQPVIGFLQTEPIWLQRPGLFQSSIQAPQAIAHSSTQQIPRCRRCVRARLSQHLNTGFHHRRLQHRSAFPLPFQHQPVARWATTGIRWRCASATQANGHFVLFGYFLDVEHMDVPLPPIQGVANVKKLFLPVQFELMQRLGSSLPAKAVELGCWGSMERKTGLRLCDLYRFSVSGIKQHPKQQPSDKSLPRVR